MRLSVEIVVVIPGEIRRQARRLTNHGFKALIKGWDFPLNRLGIALRNQFNQDFRSFWKFDGILQHDHTVLDISAAAEDCSAFAHRHDFRQTSNI